MFDLPEIQGSQVLERNYHALSAVVLLNLHPLLLLNGHAVVHLLAHGTLVLLERVVQRLAAHARVVVRVRRLKLLLLLQGLDDRHLIHRDAVLLLELVRVVVQEGLIPAHLVTEGHQVDLADALFHAHLLKGEEELLRDVQDVLRKVRPLALRVYQRLPGVLFLLLEDQIVLLEHKESLFDVLGLRTDHMAGSCVPDLLLEVCVPVEKLRTGDLGEVLLEEGLQLGFQVVRPLLGAEALENRVVHGILHIGQGIKLKKL